MTNVEFAWDVCLEIGFYKLQYVNYYAKGRRISRDAFFSLEIFTNVRLFWTTHVKCTGDDKIEDGLIPTEKGGCYWHISPHILLYKITQQNGY